MSGKVLAWNTGPGGTVAAVLGAWDGVTAGPEDGALEEPPGRGLADVRPGEGDGTCVADREVPLPHPAAARLSTTAMITAATILPHVCGLHGA